MQETLHATHLKLLDKMYQYEMDPTPQQLWCAGIINSAQGVDPGNSGPSYTILVFINSVSGDALAPLGTRSSAATILTLIDFVNNCNVGVLL